MFLLYYFMGMRRCRRFSILSRLELLAGGARWRSGRPG